MKLPSAEELKEIERDHYLFHGTSLPPSKHSKQSCPLCRLIAENARLRDALVEIADAGSGGGVKRRQIARRALARP